MTTHAPTDEERAAFVASRPKRRWWRTRRSTASGSVGGRVMYFARSASVIDSVSKAHYLEDTDLALRTGSTVAVFDPQAVRRRSIALALAGLRPLDAGSVWMPARSRSVLISPDEALIPSLTLSQNLIVPCAAMGEIVDPGEIRRRAARLGVDLDRVARDVSATDLLKFQVLRALIYRADLVVVSDFPIQTEDAPSFEDFSEACELLRASGACVVFFTDSPEAAALAQRVLIVANSTIVADAAGLDAHFIRMACDAINENPSAYLGPIPRAGEPVTSDASVPAFEEDTPADDAEAPAEESASINVTPAASEDDETSVSDTADGGEVEDHASAMSKKGTATPNWHPLTTRVIRTADSPLPTPLPSQWEENPETAEIALAAIEQARRFHRIEQARASLGDELKEQLNEDLPTAAEASPEERALIEHAQKILGELPGSVIPDGEDSTAEGE
ncbi:MAG: hypothetical protein E6925_05640 [Actinomyces sp.]|uniref:hypothetical protein n=1 Tax=Actinomyces sp. TaxID=29317 RepID=UPI0025DC0A32|nr:hypothetical protein [Actinomyces sp.]MDU1431170.1 hypothetical protein [Actinomyces sp.]